MPKTLAFLPIAALVLDGRVRAACKKCFDTRSPGERMSETFSFETAPTNPEHEELKEWLAGISRGERYALGRLYDAYSRPLFGLAVRLLRDKSEAEDVVHDVFVSLKDVALTFDPSRGSVLAWLTTITRNKALDRLRKSKRRTELLAQAAPSDFGWEPAEAPAKAAEPGSEGASVAHVSHEPSPAHAAESNDRAGVIKKAVSELPPEQRNALELAFFSGFTQQEIADKLQEPLGTIKARIRRGLLQLREVVGNRL